MWWVGTFMVARVLFLCAPWRSLVVALLGLNSAITRFIAHICLKS
jgi:hypothetical protein